ncbi:hypothetical protein K438DRAFT_1979887 [Mycena galopus ATCC 62051]|nr:hypothetical protein K438DRAFT_1979887 [Mycena galopus ATCC 62051]
MPLREALGIVSVTGIERLVFPRWIYRLPITRLRDIETAYTSLDAHMKVLLASRRAERVEGNDTAKQKDVFRLMMRAHEGEGTLSMTDEELVSDVPGREYVFAAVRGACTALKGPLDLALSSRQAKA